MFCVLPEMNSFNTVFTMRYAESGNHNTWDNVYGSVIMTESLQVLQQFTRFI